MHGGDEGYSKTAAPVAGKIGQTRALIVLTWRQVGISKHADGNKQKGITEALQRARQCVVGVVCLQREAAVIKHGECDHEKAEGDQPARTDFSLLRQYRYERRQDRDHRRSWPQNQARIGGGVTVQALQDLRDHGRATEENEAKQEIENVREREISLAQQPELDDRIGHSQFPPDSEHQANNGCYKHGCNHGAAKPVVDLTTIEYEFQE